MLVRNEGAFSDHQKFENLMIKAPKPSVWSNYCIFLSCRKVLFYSRPFLFHNNILDLFFVQFVLYILILCSVTSVNRDACMTFGMLPKVITESLFFKVFVSGKKSNQICYNALGVNYITYLY